MIRLETDLRTSNPNEVIRPETDLGTCKEMSLKMEYNARKTKVVQECVATAIQLFGKKFQEEADV